ncbi:hypothetical protein SLI_7335 [Streptomyces lividans 1326]|uniref:Uncharacterized protein n=1 Tax=Streptomyces lividans 1326 TaxID=1200984 RepID=A0A7U9DXM7_STRLI|nr:hypothetical protein SLI_7335 [Streptomyces lividans 1326]
MGPACAGGAVHVACLSGGIVIGVCGTLCRVFTFETGDPPHA